MRVVSEYNVGPAEWKINFIVFVSKRFYYLFYLASPFPWETTQNDPQGLTCR